MDKDFFKLLPRKRVWEILDSFNVLPTETIEASEATRRIASEDVISPEDLPPFPRSTMDGFAVRARDTFGASESEPGILRVVTEVKMGQDASRAEIAPGECVKIWTGGHVPEEADAVLMLEYTRGLDDRTIEIFKAVVPGENVILQGDDCKKGEVAVRSGTRLRAQELGLFSALGIKRVGVTRRPRVAIISTGDEICPVNETPSPGKVRDVNSTTLSSFIKTDGGIPVPLGIVPDSRKAILSAIKKAVFELDVDICLVSGGSSVGARDYTVSCFKEICGRPPLVHGVAIRPGKPTIISRLDNKALFGLPGHVASCMVVYLLFVHYLIHRMSGVRNESPFKSVLARSTQAIPSVIGREDYVRVSLKRAEGKNSYFLEPIYGRSGLISTLVKADGLLVIPRDSEGIYPDEEAEVILLP